MRILQICNRIPFPLLDGGSIAIYQMTKGLKELGHDLTLLGMNTSKNQLDESPSALTSLAELYSFRVDNEVKPWDALLNLFSKESYHVSRFVSVGFDSLLGQLLSQQTFDLIMLEGIFVCPYIDTIRKHSKARLILRAHNVEHKIWELLGANAAFPKSWYLKLLAKRLKKFEIEQLNKVDGLVAISDGDLRIFTELGCTRPKHVSPTGMDLLPIKEPTYEFPSLFHIGSMDWMPNVEGVRWFLAEAWPKLHSLHPGLKLYLAGRKTPKWMKRLSQDGVVVAGEVDSAVDFMRSKAIMIVPLRSGSGIRIKILEALSLNKAVVSTSLGAEGIPNENGAISLADTPSEFVEAISNLVQNKDRVEEKGRLGRSIAEQHYQNNKLISDLLEFQNKLP